MAKMKKILLLVCTGIIILLNLTACKQLPEKAFNEIDFQKFITDIQENRKPLVTGKIPMVEIEKLKPSHAIRREIEKEEYLQLIQPKNKESKHIYTKDELHQDVDIMFDLFENFYGAYKLFGGAEKFDQVKDNIKERIDSDMSIIAMTNIILDELSVFPDGHMAFNGIRIYPKQETYMAKDLYVLVNDDLYIEDRDGIYKILQPEKWTKYIRPTLDAEGKLTYGFFKRVGNKEKVNKLDTIRILDHEGQETIKTLQWVKLESNEAKEELVLSEKRKDGILIQKIPSCSDDEYPVRELEKEFASYGQRAYEETRMILDLRGNSGGYSGPPKAWSRPFLGENPTSKRVGGGVFNRLYKFYPNTGDNLDEAFLDKYFDGNWRVESLEGQWIESDKWILILSDDGVASAAEEFIFLLRQLNSSIILGVPSSGCNMVGENIGYYLPNTGIPISFGFVLNFSEEINDDSTSFIEPDIWVDPAEAEEKAILFMKYYQIGQGK